MLKYTFSEVFPQSYGRYRPQKRPDRCDFRSGRSLNFVFTAHNTGKSVPFIGLSDNNYPAG